jgi:thiol:disulfide interchange protein DsbD
MITLTPVALPAAGVIILGRYTMAPMTRFAITLLACLLAAPLAQSGAQAQAGIKPTVKVSLLSARATVHPGERFTVAIRQKIPSGWHTYWRNPGDSGGPMNVTWDLPAGASASALEWPTPKVLRYGPLVNYAYTGEALLLANVTAPQNSGPLALKAHLDWVVCRDVCIPEEADVVLTVAVGAVSTDNPQGAKTIDAARARLPEKAGFDARLAAADGKYVLTARGAGLAQARKIEFLPFEAGKIDGAAAQTNIKSADEVRLTLEPYVSGQIEQGTLSGLLVFEAPGKAGRRAVEIAATPGGSNP